MKRAHAMPFGATLLPEGGVRYRLWAPALSAVDLIVQSDGRTQSVTMAQAGDGWFEAVAGNARAGDRYLFRVDDNLSVPDPASRFQPEGVHAAGEVIDPNAFTWRDDAWMGRPWEESVIYELHVGAFSPEGTYAAAERRLDYLAKLGVTVVELMPLSAAPGKRNWGYDGVYPFAPTANYGRPEELKSFIQAAHAKGLMVFLDVVYNHFGPEGNYLHRTAPQFFTDRYATPWGAAIDFDNPNARPVRDFFIQNALYWLHEFNIDGLRLDAVHAIFDKSEPHILVELADAVRAATPQGRHFHLVLENDKNEARYLARGGGRPKWYAAQWNDDIHHAFHVLATGETEGYYADYADNAIDRLGRALSEGFVYQGEPSRHRGGEARGEPSRHLPPGAFVSFVQNHDQIGNRAFGERIAELAPDDAVRAVTALLLLSPSPPLIFMGEEWGSRTPFLFFCDFGRELTDAVREGRRREFAHFAAFADEEARARIPDPAAAETFTRSILDWESAARPEHAAWLTLYTQLLLLRRRVIVPRLKGMQANAATYARRNGDLLEIVWTLADRARLTVCANLSATARRDETPLPGEEIFCTHARRRTGEWPAWCVAFSLAEAAGG